MLEDSVNFSAIPAHIYTWNGLPFPPVLWVLGSLVKNMHVCLIGDTVTHFCV